MIDYVTPELTSQLCKIVLDITVSSWCIESFKIMFYYQNHLQGDGYMIKSPCLGCEFAGQDKNKCLENCEKLKHYQELILKEGIYAKI